ncbi:transposase [Dankookia rubra]|uniref:transposase n=1 Tax=Dankookia rubra TaxID=1442381 RepID=UPI0034DFECB6
MNRRSGLLKLRWPHGRHRGGARRAARPWCPDAAIQSVLMLRLVFHLALRQSDGFVTGVLRLLGQARRVPDCRLQGGAAAASPSGSPRRFRTACCFR